jgi:hypothetical protein
LERMSSRNRVFVGKDDHLVWGGRMSEE